MRRTFALFLILVAVAAPVSAQSLFNTRGLGTRLDPADARSRALGNVGIGLLGFNGSLVNPADLSNIVRRGVTASIQPFYGSDNLNGQEADVSGTRFPVLQILYPFSARTVVSLGYGGVFDQSWAVQTEGEDVIGGNTFRFRDVLSSRGGISQVRLSGSYRLTPDLSVGVGGGVYTGTLDRRLRREFTSAPPDSLPDFTSDRSWTYSGPFAVVGATWDPLPTMRIAAAVTWSGDLDADGDTDDDGVLDPAVGRSYDLPLRAAFGASAVVGRRLLATVSGDWEGWSDGNYTALGSEAGQATTASSSWVVGGGLEWEELRTATRIFPLRAGFRYAKLPFHNVGEEQPTEWAITGGIGFRLAYDDFGPLAVADLGIERGRREGWEGGVSGALEENFWRFTASVSLFAR